MIPAVHARGTRVGGLLRYLYGPGKREEHANPHLVAAWDGAGDLADLEPAVTALGRRDFRHLVDLLEIPVRAGRNPPGKTVWHCSVRSHASDRLLTDEQWGHIAAEVVAEVGLARHGDQRAVRWVAVRHADDHIHSVATLVRQDRRTVWPRYDYAQTQAACRDIERRYNLYRVAPAGQGSRTWPKAGEVNKAARKRRTAPPREQLRRIARETATLAVDEDDFLSRLARAGVQVRLRPSHRDPGEITGYSIALPGDTTATGQPIYYSGGKLAADLSLPQLRNRWGTDTSLAGARRSAARLHPAPTEVYARAAHLLAEASATIRHAADDPATVATIAHAAADLLTATAGAWEGQRGGPLSTAAELLDRVVHDRERVAPAQAGRHGYQVRALARLVTLMGARDCDTAHALDLVRAMAAFADTLADLRQALDRLHQAHAAQAAAAILRTYKPPSIGASRPSALAHQHAKPQTAAQTPGPTTRRHR